MLHKSDKNRNKLNFYENVKTKKKAESFIRLKLFSKNSKSAPAVHHASHDDAFLLSVSMQNGRSCTMTSRRKSQRDSLTT